MRKRSLIAVALVAVAILASACTPPPVVGGGGTTTSPSPHKPLFVHYYLWWDAAHWRSKLGSSYPYASSPVAKPASLAANGCTATTPYSGNTLIDAPASPLGLYSQDNPATFVRHVQEASSAGIDGFVVSWAGSGQATQTPASAAFSRRLAMLVVAVAAHNAVPGARPFHLMLGYEGLDNSRRVRPTAWVANDLAYIARSYAQSPVFRVATYGLKPVVMVLDSRKFSLSSLQSIVAPLRPKLTLIGDEHGLTDWNRGAASVFDGDSWYWSSQNPYNNASSFTQLKALSTTLHAQHKLWFSPLAEGYDKANFGLGGVCVPRNGAQTLRSLYVGNSASNPDGWMLISWNEFVENSYIEPSAQYGASSLNAVAQLFG